MTDLARIRDNQRRSRARRKEYLQELESKFRLCEQTGAEASSEIQSAARAVAEENKRLRLLLHTYGIVDPELQNGHQSLSAAHLDRTLSVRKSCGDSGQKGCNSAPPHIQSRHLQPPRQSPPPYWEPDRPTTWGTSPVLAADQFPAPQRYMPSNLTSCHEVAAVIRSVRPNMGSELEAQLGCADGRDCSIPTTRAFDLLDRLSESQNSG